MLVRPQLLYNCSGRQRRGLCQNCSLCKRNLFDHHLREIGAAALLSDENLPIGVWPKLFARLNQKKWNSHIYYFLREKAREIFGKRSLLQDGNNMHVV